MTYVKSAAIAILAVLGTAAAFGGGVYGAVMLDAEPQPAAVAAAKPHIALDPAMLTAKAAALYDLRDGSLIYQKLANEPLPLASLTKLMAVQTVLKYASPDTQVTITAADLAPEGDWGFYPGQTLSLRDLIRFSLVASSNDAIEAAVRSLGAGPIDLMNDTAAEMGLTQSRFYNASGLDMSATEAGAYGSAYDVTRLGAAFYNDHADLFELTTKADVHIADGTTEQTAAATTLPLASLPGLVAAKTGYTDLAGGNLVAVFDLEPGHTVVGAVLGSTRDGRFSDMQTLIEAARASL